MVNCLEKIVLKRGFKPQHFIIGLNSDLMDHSINLHVHSINSDIGDILLNWFMKIDQSGMQKHHKESLTTQQFEIDILALELKNGMEKTTNIGKKRQKRHPGSGGRIKFRHNINLNAIIEIDNADNYCLFTSFEILRNMSIMEPEKFARYKANKKRQLNDVYRLLRACEIPTKSKSYSIEEWGEKICEYYRNLHGQMFRLFAFPEFGDFKVSFLFFFLEKEYII